MRRPTLVFPSGTACLFFNNIARPLEAGGACQACRAGRTVKVDMGELFWLDENGREKRHGFIIIAGSGFDAEIMMKAAPTKNDIGEDRLLPLRSRHAQPHGGALYH